MTQIPVKRLLTFEAYLEYDDGTDNLYELVDGKLVQMTPASPEHSDSTASPANLYEVAARSNGSGCIYSGVTQ